MTPESSALRESIRQGLIAAHVDRAEFDWAVARVYELERKQESDVIHLRESCSAADDSDDDWTAQP